MANIGGLREVDDLRLVLPPQNGVSRKIGLFTGFKLAGYSEVWVFFASGGGYRVCM
jgi:hypothetical protein